MTSWPTPNPRSVMFFPEDRQVLGAGTRTKIYKDFYECQSSPLAKVLLSIDGVREVMLAAEHITVTKHALAEWMDMEDDITQAISSFFDKGLEPVDANVIEKTGAHVAHEEGSIEARIIELLEDRIKPFVQQDGGDVEFDRFDRKDGVLYLMMKGSCSGCSQSHATLQVGVKNMLDHYIPEVKEIVGLNEEVDEEIPRPGRR